MSAKLSNLNELSNILRQKEKADEGVLAFSKQFKIGKQLKPFSKVKKQGYSLYYKSWRYHSGRRLFTGCYERYRRYSFLIVWKNEK